MKKSAEDTSKFESPGHNFRLENYLNIIQLYSFIHVGILLLLSYKFNIKTWFIEKLIYKLASDKHVYVRNKHKFRHFVGIMTWKSCLQIEQHFVPELTKSYDAAQIGRNNKYKFIVLYYMQQPENWENMNIICRQYTILIHWSVSEISFIQLKHVLLVHLW